MNSAIVLDWFPCVFGWANFVCYDPGGLRGCVPESNGRLARALPLALLPIPFLAFSRGSPPSICLRSQVNYPITMALEACVESRRCRMLDALGVLAAPLAALSFDVRQVPERLVQHD